MTISPFKTVKDGRSNISHHGVLLLVKADRRLSAVEAVTEFMQLYDKAVKVEPYIEATAAEIEAIREEMRQRLGMKRVPKHLSQAYGNGRLSQMTPQEFYGDYAGPKDFDEHGNALSTENPKGVWNRYRIGGVWANVLGDGDGVSPLAACQDVVESWRERVLREELPMTHEILIDAERRGDTSFAREMANHFTSLKQQRFSEDIGVYNITTGNCSIPLEPQGWWVVVVDLY